MNRRDFLLSSVALWAGARVGAARGVATASARPNVVVILADDLGYGDTSVYDGWIKTPQLERMASQGLKFVDFHSNSSVCSPMRAAFLTGRYQQRVGIVDVIASHLDTPGLEATELTIPRLMKQYGYRTSLFGKWHLGSEPRQNPIHHGFDEFVGYLEGATDYHNHKDWYNGLHRENIMGYSTHLITDHAIRFIEENKSRPFFLYVAHQAPHLPFQTPADTMDNRPKERLTSKEMWDPNRIRPKYKIMVEEMDRGIGQILDTLERVRVSKDTFVFFFSDNGAILSGGSNQPFRGGKFSHYEGGHRVPAIAWWPGKIAAGTTTDATTMGMDLFPTIMDLASIPIPPERKLDGMSMKDLLLHQADFPTRQLFWGYEPKLGTAMRDGNWKLIVSSQKYELYNLDADISESKNLLEEYPERAMKMKEILLNWSKAVTIAPSK